MKLKIYFGPNSNRKTGTGIVAHWFRTRLGHNPRYQNPVRVAGQVLAAPLLI